MPVGVDGVLIGAWATNMLKDDATRLKRVLDIGTGCGVISLIIAQRLPDADIDAIDIDLPSVEEATANFDQSQWSGRLHAMHTSLEEICAQTPDTYDLIVSNPPFFNSGVSAPATAREKARHEASLPPSQMAQCSSRMLRPDGSLALIVPCEGRDRIVDECRRCGLTLIAETIVRGRADLPPKRALLLFKKSSGADCHREELTLEIAPNKPTEVYRDLCRDLYLKF